MPRRVAEIEKRLQTFAIHASAVVFYLIAE